MLDREDGWDECGTAEDVAEDGWTTPIDTEASRA